ncbi:hypothetical protein AVEN_62598-1, partial [Araneus ventricosus]
MHYAVATHRRPASFPGRTRFFFLLHGTVTPCSCLICNAGTFITICPPCYCRPATSAAAAATIAIYCSPDTTVHIRMPLLLGRGLWTGARQCMRCSACLLLPWWYGTLWGELIPCNISSTGFVRWFSAYRRTVFGAGRRAGGAGHTARRFSQQRNAGERRCASTAV